MNENNQDINQVNENPDLEKTVVISNNEIKQAIEPVTAEPIQAPVVETPVQAPAEEVPVQEPVVETPIAEQVVAVEENKETIAAPVQEQTTIENIPGQSNDIGTVENIVDNSQIDVTNTTEEKKEEPKVYKDPSKLSTVLVILLFIALFVFVFEMPKISEWLETRNQKQEINAIEAEAKRIEEEEKKAQEAKEKQREEAKKEEEKKEASMKTLTCTLTVPATETSKVSQKITETFDYNEKSQVVTSTYTTLFTFTSQDENYKLVKTNCENYSNKYMEKTGYSISCMSNDLTVTVGNEYDLTTFKEEQDGNETIKANAKLNENINDVKTRLTTKGYTCQ